mmetsp:Transcript_17087/g.32477  ORF Transcript_17087/g.32477 Transcript_17087/m.32477 type:complete len:207 (+) Transcript_17087:263-883(+)
MRVPARVRHVTDAAVHVLHHQGRVHEQRLHLSPSTPRRSAEGLPVVRPGLLPARPQVPQSTSTTCCLSGLPGWVLHKGPHVWIRTPQVLHANVLWHGQLPCGDDVRQLRPDGAPRRLMSQHQHYGQAKEMATARRCDVFQVRSKGPLRYLLHQRACQTTSRRIQASGYAVRKSMCRETHSRGLLVMENPLCHSISLPRFVPQQHAR